MVQQSRRGDMAAFETLYRANVDRINGLCLRMCGDPGLAEELTQEAFIRAWTRLGSFRGDSAFSTWMHRLTVNVVLGHRRSRDRREGRVSLADETALDQARAPRRAPETSMDLERAIALLPRRAREVFVLHDVEGYRHREIAKLAGMAEGTSKAQLSRARRLLREALSS